MSFFTKGEKSLMYYDLESAVEDGARMPDSEVVVIWGKITRDEPLTVNELLWINRVCLDNLIDIAYSNISGSYDRSERMGHVNRIGRANKLKAKITFLIGELRKGAQ
jgi:hypothetical protein